MTMAPQHQQYLETLEASQSLYRELADVLRQGCDAIAQMDVDGIYQSISDQEAIAAKLRILDTERQTALNPPGSDRLELTMTERIRSMEAELASSRKEVQRWNRLQNALLERSARNVTLLANSLVSFFATYPSPYATSTNSTGNHPS